MRKSNVIHLDTLDGLEFVSNLLTNRFRKSIGHKANRRKYRRLLSILNGYIVRYSINLGEKIGKV